MDSFDDRDTAHLSEKAVGDYTDGIIGPGGLCGTNCFSDASIGDGIRYGWTSEDFTVQVGLAFKANQVNACELAAVGNREGGLNVQWFFRNPVGTGDIQFWTGPNTVLGTLRHTASGVAPIGSYIFIEMRVFLDAVNGTIAGAINGSQVFSLTGIDTTEFWSPTDFHGTLEVHCTGDGACIDNVYVMDGEGTAPTNASQWIGPWHVIQMTPFDDGDARGWSPSAGSDNYAMVDEIPPDENTTYVSSNAEGPSDLYRFLSVVLPSDTLYAVQRSFQVTRTATGHTEVSHLDKVSGVLRETERWGVQSGDWYSDTQIDDTDPTGAKWSIATFNRTQFGMKHYTSKSSSVGFPA
jgi:hypothetical protein